MTLPSSKVVETLLVVVEWSVILCIASCRPMMDLKTVVLVKATLYLPSLEVRLAYPTMPTTMSKMSRPTSR